MENNFITEYRDKELIKAFSDLIKSECKNKINIMEICGGHTHNIMKFAIPDLVGENINFIHGPGCPVCIMPKQRIDEACKLAQIPNTIFCTLADMLRVPGSHTSLQKLRGEGCDIRALYSPLDALKLAQENKDKNVIFFAIGFETTTPMTAVLIQKCIDLNLKNLFFHINHVTIPNPVEAILNDENVKIDAFLGPSHVSVITGSNSYEDIASKFKKPIAISGFEPVDLLESILNLVRQINNNSFEVYNQYKRAVKKDGNLKAKELVKTYLQECDFVWRGLGEIKNSGMELKKEFSYLDAREVFDVKINDAQENKACRCPDILRGRAKPYDCKIFGKVCNPQNPVGACMVSSEGACAAYYKYAKRKVNG